MQHLSGSTKTKKELTPFEKVEKSILRFVTNVNTDMKLKEAFDRKAFLEEKISVINAALEDINDDNPIKKKFLNQVKVFQEEIDSIDSVLNLFCEVSFETAGRA
jgi:hypothetical protein